MSAAVVEMRRTRMRQSTALARRAIIATARQPQNLVPALVMPLVFSALNSAALSKTMHLPGFPKVDSYVDFLLATTICQGVLFGSAAAGNDMAIDIETKFFDRLLASPVSRPAILVGRVAGSGVLAGAQAILFMLVLAPFGASVKAGLPGIIALVLAAAFLGAGVGAISVALAIKTGSAEAVQSAFPLFFAFLFFSSGYFPRNLMHGWFHSLVSANPITWMVEGMRHLVIRDFAINQVAQALAVPIAVFVVGTVLASLALRARIASR